MNIKKISHSHGFSLIEILISLAIFALVVTAGAAAILSSISANQKAQSLNSVITNVNLALESMAREIRLGSNYVAGSGNTSLSFTLDQPDKDGCSTRRYYSSGGLCY
jgi:prepilin-type N-terminal cleavage/methylation domain-containing protein